MSDADVVHTIFTLNGHEVRVSAPVDRTLVEVLREELGLTSVRGTCGLGVCGTCTVVVDQQAVSSCIMLAAAVDGREVTTSEGHANDDGLRAVQQAFVDHGAYQCSFCIPAMALSVQAHLAVHPDAGLEEVRHQLGGNLCRCGTYPQVLEAVTSCLRAPPGT